MDDAPFIQAKAVELGKHTIRMTSAAGSGHPSSGLSLAHAVALLMYKHMRWDPKDPWNPNADRLVLSEGHAVPVVYAAYADLGGMVGKSPEKARPLRIEDLQQLRTLNSELDGHPNPAEGFPFFDAATGSLGQGLSVAAGLAASSRLQKIDMRIFVLIGDGEAREGQIWEAADFIVDHELNNICALFSCNGQGQADFVSPQQSADALGTKLSAFGWDVVQVDGHDPAQLDAQFGRVGQTHRPLAVVARTVKGWGVPSLQDGNWHGKPVPADQVGKACAELDATLAEMKLPAGEPTIRMEFAGAGRTTELKSPDVTLPPFAEACERAGMGAVMEKKKLATRRAYGVALAELGRLSPRIVALDGDVRNSTFSEMFAKAFPERFLECKIAEQNMISVAVGLARSGLIPFASSFAKFLSRGFDQVEMASITRANIKLVGSHAGVSLGADGPSQMGLSDVAFFRSFCGVDDGQGRRACVFFQPSDAISAYRLTELMARHQGMCYMRTHRPDLPFLYNENTKFQVGGSHLLREGSDLTLVGSGFTVGLALQAAEKLERSGARCNVFDAYSLPLDCEPILNAARKGGGRIVVIEDNYAGGLHSEIAEAAAAAGDVRVSGMTVRRIPKSGRTADDVLKWVGLSQDDIVSCAKG